jgi:hypothetical protein
MFGFQGHTSKSALDKRMELVARAIYLLLQCVFLGGVVYALRALSGLEDDPLLPCAEFNPALPQCAWSSSYDEAVAKFRLVTKNASFVESLHVAPGLSVETAVFVGGRPNDLVVHISGTHGVEAFVGSAIQIAAAAGLRRVPNGPTVVMVHVLNPFGMKFSRRVNENNVDLNRNMVTNASVYARDANVAGYEDFAHVFNPEGEPGWGAYADWAKGLLACLLRPGAIAKFRRALITGTYSHPKGIYYGGQQIEASHKLLTAFLARHGFLANAERVVLIDVHSGLGPFARDTLMAKSEFGLARMFASGRNAPAFAGPFVAPVGIEVETAWETNADADASVGYDAAQGLIDGAYPAMFAQANPAVKVASCAQEFGTVSPITVAYNAIHENQAWHWSKSAAERAKMGARLKASFAPSKQEFAAKVVSRGLTLLFQAIAGVGEL